LEFGGQNGHRSIAVKAAGRSQALDVPPEVVKSVVPLFFQDDIQTFGKVRKEPEDGSGKVRLGEKL